ncbi:MAM and LDL-receptor class A domain-containing protein 2, partial [Caerostris extrusa]
EDTCLWTNDPDADLQWLRGSGEITDAAPLNDTTFGNQFGTTCMFTWYKHGLPTPNLHACCHHTSRLPSNSCSISLKEKLGRWNNEQVEIDEDKDDGKYQIIFEAQMTTAVNSFIALDDLTVYEGACKPIEDRKPDFTCEDGG